MKLWSMFRALFCKAKLDAEMAEEVRLHLELQTEKNVAAGMDSDEASYVAQRSFGGVERSRNSAAMSEGGCRWSVLLAGRTCPL